MTISVSIDGSEPLRGEGVRDLAPVMVRMRDIRKTYANQTTPAVEGLSLDIREGEIFSLLGPSGCGKTTTLRIVAGLETPDAGSIHFKDRPVVLTEKRLFVPPEKRQIGMVFQSYAIWPHMTVAENVAYPLKARGVKKDLISTKVQGILELVGMAHLASRSAMLLSGGQQQRVALARALVYEPSILLLDEPFSNLDTKLREQMRIEIKILQRKLGITVLFVTHDQVEALSLSSRIAVMHQGIVQQVGTPRELYEAPANAIVRDFIGRSVCLSGIVTGLDRSIRVELPSAHGACSFELLPRPGQGDLAIGQEVVLTLRPEDISISPWLAGDPLDASLLATVETTLFEGERTEVQVRLADHTSVLVHGSRHDGFREGDKVRLRIPADRLMLWTK
jgi:ABC-type Fe3+/spermidine/putrescine transport system ATPase subunit